MAALANIVRRCVPGAAGFGALGVAAVMAFLPAADRQPAAAEIGGEIPSGGTPRTDGAPAFETGTLEWNPDQGKIFKRILRGIGALKPLRLRGTASRKIYAETAPSVVLIAAKEGTGSGVVVGPGRILTNAHVVGKERTLGVVFKPDEAETVDGSDFVHVAKVVGIDRKTDLALLELPDGAPSRPAVKLGRFSDVRVGDDVHAIGHPVGYNWTYTQGIVSQLRPNHTWRSDGAERFADVIQTQTPINPGNSGGPLLNDAGELIGVNSFNTRSAPGINFAVAATTIHEFLAVRGAAALDAPLLKKPACAGRSVFTGRTEEDDGWMAVSDQDCNGRPDFVHVVPDDKDAPIAIRMDTFDRGLIDAVIYDVDRDGRWDVSFFDIDGDGKLDLTGRHEDGKVTPSSLAEYKPEEETASDGAKRE